MSDEEPLIEARARPTGGRHSGPGGPPGMGSNEKARDFSGTMKKLFIFAGRFKGRITFAVIFAIGSTIFNIFGPRVLSQATTELFNGAVSKVAGTGGIDFGAIAGILIAALLIYAVSAVFSWAESWIMSSVSQKICYYLRDAITKKINRMPYGYFDGASIGDTLSRITNDVDTLGQSLNQGITQSLTSLVTVVGVLIMMFSINVWMTLITLIMVPISLILVAIIVHFSQKHFYAQQARLGEINGQVEETFSGHTVVKAFVHEKQTIDTYHATNERLYDAAWKSQFLSGLMPPVMTFVGNLGYVAVAISGAVFAVGGVITVGDIQAFIQYVRNFTQPITQLAQVANILQQMAAAAERIFEFIGQPEMPKEEAHVDEPDAQDVECTVDFDHVRFGYEADEPVIHDFSARVNAGQMVAVVGPTGAGKTTIVKLLMRFYDVDSGEIRIGGTDVRDYTREEVRSLFAMVLQDTWLFNGTIRENIRYGDLNATDEQIEQAAREACAHHFIMTLPGGYDFVINEDASNVSAGQRQLLTIARALLANRRMLILDEATSSVDTRTEGRIQQAMDNLLKGRTSFVIAHRLSTIRDADLILVMDHGDIVEQGTHEELLARDGFYAKLYNAQFEGESV